MAMFGAVIVGEILALIGVVFFIDWGIGEIKTKLDSINNELRGVSSTLDEISRKLDK